LLKALPCFRREDIITSGGWTFSMPLSHRSSGIGVYGGEFRRDAGFRIGRRRPV
jgi:hypothetical protein